MSERIMGAALARASLTSASPRAVVGVAWWISEEAS